MTTWIAWRIVKFIALAAFAAGIFGAVSAPTLRLRIHRTYGLAVPGLVGSWLAGWMLMKATDVSMTSPWLLAGIAASAAALIAAFRASHRPASWAPTVALGGLTASIATMSARTDDPMLGGAVLIGGGLIGALAAIPWAQGAPERSDADRAAITNGFRWIGRAEGVSFILLLGINTPLKYTVGIELDGGTGGLGWLHGTLLLVYLQALGSAARANHWSMGQVGLGFVASLLPGGPFLFERRIEG